MSFIINPKVPCSVTRSITRVVYTIISVSKKNEAIVGELMGFEGSPWKMMGKHIGQIEWTVGNKWCFSLFLSRRNMGWWSQAEQSSQQLAVVQLELSLHLVGSTWEVSTSDSFVLEGQMLLYSLSQKLTAEVCMHVPECKRQGYNIKRGLLKSKS